MGRAKGCSERRKGGESGGSDAIDDRGDVGSQSQAQLAFPPLVIHTQYEAARQPTVPFIYVPRRVLSTVSNLPRQRCPCVGPSWFCRSWSGPVSQRFRDIGDVVELETFVGWVN
jgi:hypothetical protein